VILVRGGYGGLERAGQVVLFTFFGGEWNVPARQIAGSGPGVSPGGVFTCGIMERCVGAKMWRARRISREIERRKPASIVIFPVWGGSRTQRHRKSHTSRDVSRFVAPNAIDVLRFGAKKGAKWAYDGHRGIMTYKVNVEGLDLSSPSVGAGFGSG
jgi:hypothetical protein